MRFKLILGFCLFNLFLVSCSKDTSQGGEEVSVIIPDFRLIGEDAESIYQYSYNASAESGGQINLTQSLGLDPLYLTLRQVDEEVSFFSFDSGSFTLTKQNTITGQSSILPDFYTVSDERSITWGTNSEDLVFLGYYSPRGGSDFGIRTLDPTDGSFTDLPVAQGVQQVYDPLYFRERLLLAFREEAGAYKVVIFNTETRSVMLTLDYGSGIPSILIDENGNIGILIGTGNSNFVYQVLDIETLDQEGESAFILDEFLPPGTLQGEVYGSTLFYTNYFAQPTSVPFGPAYFNFATNENFEIDVLGIVQEVEAETQLTVVLTAQRYYKDADVFLMGYANSGSQSEVAGGVLVISKTGQLIRRIELPFVPTYFVKP
jgi:hypothetical protein